MKTILIAIFIQVAAPAEPGAPPIPQVMSSLTAEFDSKEACLNAAKGLGVMGQGGGFSVLFGCAPKELAKLEVEKTKPVPKASPSGWNT